MCVVLFLDFCNFSLQHTFELVQKLERIGFIVIVNVQIWWFFVIFKIYSIVPVQNLTTVPNFPASAIIDFSLSYSTEYFCVNVQFEASNFRSSDYFDIFWTKRSIIPILFFSQICSFYYFRIFSVPNYADTVANILIIVTKCQLDQQSCVIFFYWLWWSE